MFKKGNKASAGPRVKKKPLYGLYRVSRFFIEAHSAKRALERYYKECCRLPYICILSDDDAELIEGLIRRLPAGVGVNQWDPTWKPGMNTKKVYRVGDIYIEALSIPGAIKRYYKEFCRVPAVIRLTPDEIARVPPEEIVRAPWGTFRDQNPFEKLEGHP